MTRFEKMMGLLLLLTLLLFPAQVSGQETTTTVPDVLGLTVPEAAAALNRAGLRLGIENNVQWTAESGLPQNSVGGQSLPAGEAAAWGTAVDLTVLRSPNVILLYDDNDLTLLNQSGGTLNLGEITFNTLDGSVPAAFSAARWGGALGHGDCGQVWSVGRTGPKDVEGCAGTLWLTTNNPAEHFWTGVNGGVTRFNVMQNGVERASCPAAPPGAPTQRCELYVSSGGSGGDVTAYVYFAYTPDRLVVRNRSVNQWMPLAGLNVLNNRSPIPGAGVPVGDPTLFSSPQIVASIERLAPGQCVMFTNSSPATDEPPEACDVIARLDIDPSLTFWGADFGVDSVTDDQAHTCPAAVEGQLTICVMPR